MQTERNFPCNIPTVWTTLLETITTVLGYECVKMVGYAADFPSKRNIKNLKHCLDVPYQPISYVWNLSLSSKIFMNKLTLLLIIPIGTKSFTVQKKKFSIKAFFQQMWLNRQFSVDLITFTEEILNGKPLFLCSDSSLVKSKTQAQITPFNKDNKQKCTY